MIKAWNTRRVLIEKNTLRPWSYSVPDLSAALKDRMFLRLNNSNPMPLSAITVQSVFDYFAYGLEIDRGIVYKRINYCDLYWLQNDKYPFMFSDYHVGQDKYYFYIRKDFIK